MDAYLPLLLPSWPVLGFNIAEARNLFHPSWIPFGISAETCITETLNVSCPHDTTFIEMMPFVRKHQPHMLEAYKAGKLRLDPHPLGKAYENRTYGAKFVNCKFNQMNIEIKIQWVPCQMEKRTPKPFGSSRMQMQLQKTHKVSSSMLNMYMLVDIHTQK